MNISKPWKIIIGIFTFSVAALPFIMVAAYFFFFFAMFSQIGNMDPSTYDTGHPSDFDPSFFGYFFLGMTFFMCLGLLQFVLTIFYIIHVINNEQGSKIWRSLCGVGFTFLPWIAMPAYFLIFIAPAKVPDWALETAATSARRRS